MSSYEQFLDDYGISEMNIKHNRNLYTVYRKRQSCHCYMSLLHEFVISVISNCCSFVSRHVY